MDRQYLQRVGPCVAMPPPKVPLPGVVVDVNSVDADGGEVVVDPFGHVGLAVLHDGTDSDSEVVCVAAVAAVVDDVVDVRMRWFRSMCSLIIDAPAGSWQPDY